jgi:hypothetical protein
LRSSNLDFSCRIDFSHLRAVADADKPPRFMNQQASTLGSGYIVFETTFLPEGEVLANPLPPANADDRDLAAPDTYILNTPLASLVKRRVRPNYLTHQY